MKKLNPDIISDIMCGEAYKFEDDTLNLILFADAATYNKSCNKSMWAVFSAIVEMPKILRYSSENIIFHSSWYGLNPDFNIFLEKYNKQIDKIIDSGILMDDGKKIKFKIHTFLGDAPARAKACNCNAYNGKYGCIKCHHPTIFTSTTVYPSLESVQKWTFTKNNKVYQPFKNLFEGRHDNYVS